MMWRAGLTLGGELGAIPGEDCFCLSGVCSHISKWTEAFLPLRTGIWKDRERVKRRWSLQVAICQLELGLTQGRKGLGPFLPEDSELQARGSRGWSL